MWSGSLPGTTEGRNRPLASTSTEQAPERPERSGGSSTPIRARTAQVLRRIDAGLEEARRSTASAVVRDSLFAGWDEPGNQLYADLWVDFAGQEGPILDAEECEDRVGVTWATFMAVSDSFVGPQTPVPWDPEEEVDAWNVAFAADYFEPTEANLDAAAYQVAVIGDLSTLRHLRSPHSGSRRDPERSKPVAARVNRYLRTLRLPWLPPKWWEFEPEELDR